jgi:isopenicillin N synthase-like dioxygenase
MRGDTLRTSIVETVTKHINEAFFVARDLPSDHPEVLADRRFRSANRWPTGLPGFREAILSYCETMEQLVRKLVRLLKPVPQRTQPSRRRGVLKAENESVSTPQKAQNLQ